MKKYLLLFGAAFIALGARAQAVLVEKVEAKPGSLDISYQKFKLPNGLTLIVHEDHSDPVVHLNVTYHVGSARETLGKSGFAHFFEHMLFQGSKHVKDEEHFELIRRYGGDVNGNTTRDRTSYIETFPSNFTETALWMEADRMGVFLEAFNQKKFEIQRSTVKNEKDQRYTVPYGFLMEVKDQNLYPSNHPYSWPTIGFVDDLDRADSSDLRNFFLRWYGPNNAAVIVSGDVVTEDVVKWVEKYFGGIAAGPQVMKQKVAPIKFSDHTVRTYRDPKAYVPLIYATFPTVPVYHSDEAALDILSELLSGSKSSIFYKKFVEGEYALQAGTVNNPLSVINHELAGEFAVQVVAYPFSDITQLRKMLFETLDSFEITGFSDEELERVKTKIYYGYSGVLEDVQTKAFMLSNYWYLMDGKSYNVQEDADRYKKVTREDILRVYRKYIKGKFASTIIVEPNPDATAENKYQSFNPNAEVEDAIAAIEYKNLKYTAPKDNFDRSIRPIPGTPKAVTLPNVYRKSLPNGVEIIGTSTYETPTVLVLVNVKGGHLLEGNKEFGNGTAVLTASLIEEGTTKYTAQQLENELDKIGASISFSAGQTSTSVYINAPKEHLAKALELFNEMWLNPRMDEKDFKRLRKQAEQGARSTERSRGAGASNAFRYLMYGETQLGSPATGTLDEIRSVSYEMVKNYHKKFYAPELTKIVVVGGLKDQEAYTLLSFIETWSKKGVTVTKPTEFPKFETTQVFGVNYIDEEQSELILGFRAMPFDATGEFFKSNVMNFALGGNFNSRINLNIREDKAWTYGSRSAFVPGFEDIPGYFTASASVRATATDSAVKEIMKEVNKFRDFGITAEEFQFTKEALIASEALEYETSSQKAGYLLQLVLRNLPVDYAQQQLALLQSLTKEEINALAKTNLKADEMIIVVSGDINKYKDKLEALGYGKVQLLSKDGKGKYKVYKADPKKKDSSHEKNYK